MAAKDNGGSGGPAGGQLRTSLQGLADAVGARVGSALAERVTQTAGRLNDYAEGNGNLKSALTGGAKDVAGKAVEGVEEKVPAAKMLGAPGKIKEKASQLKEGLKDAVGIGGQSGGNKQKVTNIVEEIDLGVPVSVAYDQWTRFTDFPDFMKRVEKVEQESDEKVSWTAKIFLSHRTWKSTIIEQVPDERIIWRSEGAKGFVDGAVTFHEVAPDLTRIVVVLEYNPRGFFEKTANLWRAQGRRARLELKHFRRYVMTETFLHADELEGWRGEIHEGRVSEHGESEEDEEQDERPRDEQSDEASDEAEQSEEDEGEEDEDEEDEDERTRVRAKR